MSEATEFTEVYCAPNLAQGGAVRDLLGQNGIDCTMNPSVPTFPWDGDVRLSCVVTEAARAREIIAAYFAPAPDEEEEDDDEDEDEDDENEEDEDEDDDDDDEDKKDV